MSPYRREALSLPQRREHVRSTNTLRVPLCLEIKLAWCIRKDHVQPHVTETQNNSDSNTRELYFSLTLKKPRSRKYRTDMKDTRPSRTSVLSSTLLHHH